MSDREHLEYLDGIARKAHAGDYRGTGALSKGELLYVALASGRMRELCPDDVGPEWMAHMLSVWRSDCQPTD